MLLNGKKCTYKEFLESVEFLSSMGFKFRRISSYSKDVIIFQIHKGDDIFNSKDLIVEDCKQLKKLFSLVPLRI